MPNKDCDANAVKTVKIPNYLQAAQPIEYNYSDDL